MRAIIAISFTLTALNLTGCGAFLRTGQSHTFDAETTKTRALASLHRPTTDYSAGGAIEAISGPTGSGQLILRGQVNYHQTIMDRSKSNRTFGAEAQDGHLTYLAFYATIDTANGLAVLGTAPVKRYTAVAEKPGRDSSFALADRQRAALARSDTFPSVPSADEGADAAKFYNAAGIDAQRQQHTASERLPNHYGSGIAYTYRVYKLDPKVLDYLQKLMASEGCNGGTVTNDTLTIANSADAGETDCASATAGVHYLQDLISKSANRIEWLKPVPALDKQAKEAVSDIGVGGKILAGLGWKAQHSDLAVAKQVGSVETVEKRIMERVGKVEVVPAFNLHKSVEVVFWGVPDHPWKKERLERPADPGEMRKALEKYNKTIIYNMSYAEAQKIAEEAEKAPDHDRTIGFMDAASAEPILKKYFGGGIITPEYLRRDRNHAFEAFGRSTEFMFSIEGGAKHAWYDGEDHLEQKANVPATVPAGKVIAW